MAIGLLAAPPKGNGGSVEDYDYEYETEDVTVIGTTDTVQKDTTRGIARWSIGLEGGISRFDGDISDKYNDIVPTSKNNFTLGAILEYNIAPAWSIGLDYRYIPLSAKDVRKGVVVSDFKSTMHSVDFFSSFNLVKTFLPESRSKWGLWAQVGLGHAWYNSKYRTDRAGSAVVTGGKYPYTDFNDTILLEVFH